MLHVLCYMLYATCYIFYIFMKILLFTLEYPPFKGGVANYYQNIIKHWPEPSSISALHNNDNILLKSWLYPKWLPAVWQLWRTIKKEKIKHILIGHILPLGTVAYYVAKFTKTHYSVILHGMDFTYALRKTRKRQIAKRILTKAEYIICANNYVAKLAGDFLGSGHINKITVVNPGITPTPTPTPARVHPASRERLGKRERGAILTNKYNLQNKIVLFSIGRLVKRKGFDKVINALPKILKNTPNLAYVIAGTGPDEEYLKKIIETVGTGHCPVPTNNVSTDNVIFLGKISDEKKWAWLDLCDMFIMPARQIKIAAIACVPPLARSGITRKAAFRFKQLVLPRIKHPQPATGEDFEGFGIVYLEANLCGKPVIAGNSGGVSDAVQNGVNGLSVNPESADDIANAVIKLSRDKKLRKKLGERGKERAVREFNWEKQARIIYDLINSPPTNPSQPRPSPSPVARPRHRLWRGPAIACGETPPSPVARPRKMRWQNAVAKCGGRMRWRKAVAKSGASKKQ